MGIHRGPNIVKDNLVFGYDTGYGVADNSTATRFYPGENTTNNTIKTGYAWNGDGSNQSFANKGGTTITNNSLKYNGYDTVLWTPGSSLNCYLNSTPDLDYNDSSTIWTFSCYIKRDDGAAITALSVYMYYPNGDGSASGTIVDCGNGWYRVSRTRTGSNSYISLAGFTGFTSGHKYYLSGVMLTKNNHTVPYVNVQSSRSSTQSLIDLKRTTDIDVSNISFNSTGQPDFDGTDDIITQSRIIDTASYSAEFVFKADVNTSGTEHWLGSQYPGTGRVIFDLYTNNRLRNFIDGTSINGATTIETGTWYHAVFTRNSLGGAYIYLNGIQDATGTLSTTTPVNDPFDIGGSTTLTRWFNGNIAVVKIYNTELTAAQAAQNFNAYKNRFNI
jgi:hypothetical protein